MKTRTLIVCLFVAGCGGADFTTETDACVKVHNCAGVVVHPDGTDGNPAGTGRASSDAAAGGSGGSAMDLPDAGAYAGGSGGTSAGGSGGVQEAGSAGGAATGGTTSTGGEAGSGGAVAATGGASAAGGAAGTGGTGTTVKVVCSGGVTLECPHCPFSSACCDLGSTPPVCGCSGSSTTPLCI